MKALSQNTYMENQEHILEISQIKVREHVAQHLLPQIEEVIWVCHPPSTSEVVSTDAWEQVLNNIWDGVVRPTHRAIKAFLNEN